MAIIGSVGGVSLEEISSRTYHPYRVDAFVYDTSKDSDGGAWRYKTHNTSWYNEEVQVGDWLGLYAGETNARNSGATLGPELVTNGYFTDGLTGWSSTSFTISDDDTVVNEIGAFGYVDQTIALDTSKTYRVYVEIADGGGGTFSVQLRGGTTYDISGSPAAGDIGPHEFFATPLSGNDTIRVYSGTSSHLKVKSVSVREVLSQTTNEGDYYQNRTDGHFYKLNAGSGQTQIYRGKRREFPALALIIAERSKITIYDADDPSLPMWMEFHPFAASSTPQWWRGGARYAKAVSAIEGIMAFAIDGDGNGGLAVVDFAKDNLSRYNHDYLYGNITVAERHDDIILQYLDSTLAIADYDANDVAMTVLPDAPINVGTGLRVPTIAVTATNGFSVIKDDGTISSPAVILAAQGADFDEYGNVTIVRDSTLSNGLKYISTFSPPNYDTIVEGYNSFVGTSYGDMQISINRGYGRNNINVHQKHDIIANGHDKGNALIQRNFADYSKGMVYTRDAHSISGWMVGQDIKGAYLADVDSDDLSDTNEYVVNGGFDTDTDWTKGGGWTISGGILTFDGVTFGSIYQNTGSIVTGKTYRIDVTMAATGVSGVGQFFVRLKNTQVAVYNPQPNATYTLYSIAGSSGNEIDIYSNSTFPISFESISITDAVADRTQDGKGLSVIGTITRTPVATGAELVGYSNLRGPSGNYLVNDYNSGLDFGTGDFHIMGWFYHTTWPLNNAEPSHIYRGSNYYGVSDNNIWTRFFLGAPELILGMSSSKEIITASQIMRNSHWQHVVWLRRSGTIEIYIDGILITTGTSTRNLTNTNAKLYIGCWDNNGSPTSGDVNMKMALARIGAVAPTPQQIKKIYQDEKVLFEENAQCTLYGTSSDVKQIAYDESADQTHVLTNSGRSVFKGLKRIHNTNTGNFLYSLSTHNGLIIEG